MRTANLFLFLLVRWPSVADVRGWLAQSLLNPETAMAFLRATLNKTQASGHRGTRTIYSLSLNHTWQFADLKSLAAAAATAARDQLDKAAVEKLQAALSAKQGASPQPEIYVLTRDEDGQLIFDPSDART